jgi:CheY-like chemotaxis protein
MRTVLLIDDEEDIRTVGRISLAQVGGWEVLEAPSGKRGLEIAASNRPDAILLDSMMPEMDGAETIRRLKADEETWGIPVIFLTAKLQPADRERYLELGAVGVLPKPFDPMKLPSDVANTLGWDR